MLQVELKRGVLVCCLFLPHYGRNCRIQGGYITLLSALAVLIHKTMIDMDTSYTQNAAKEVPDARSELDKNVMAGTATNR